MEKKITPDSKENLVFVIGVSLYLTKTNNKDIANLNKPITNNEIESVMKNLQTKNSPGADGFKLNSNKHLKNEYQLSPCY